jgi:hypothetical protein
LGEEVEVRIIVQIAVDASGTLHFTVNTDNALELWGFSKQLEKMADELAFVQQSKVRQSKPRLVVPGS